jgi:hypothetical protein
VLAPGVLCPEQASPVSLVERLSIGVLPGDGDCTPLGTVVHLVRVREQQRPSLSVSRQWVELLERVREQSLVVNKAVHLCPYLLGE